MIPDNIILLDVGGTFIKCSDSRSVPIDSDGTREEIIAALRQAVWGGEAAPEGAAIQLRAAVPGPFDYTSGQFLMKHKFAAVYGEYFADMVGLPRENCRFIHDVNCMLLGEVGICAESSPECENTALIALGTGLGFAMFVDGKILKNEAGSPAVSIFNRPFRDGVLEDYASKRGVLRLYGHDDLTVKDIALRAVGGDLRASDAFARMGDIIGDVIAPILKEYNIKKLLLGGQISRSWRLFAPAIEAKLNEVGIRMSVGPVSDFDNATFKGLKKL